MWGKGTGFEIGIRIRNPDSESKSGFGIEFGNRNRNPNLGSRLQIGFFALACGRVKCPLGPYFRISPAFRSGRRPACRRGAGDAAGPRMPEDVDGRRAEDGRKTGACSRCCCRFPADPGLLPVPVSVSIRSVQVRMSSPGRGCRRCLPEDAPRLVQVRRGPSSSPGAGPEAVASAVPPLIMGGAGSVRV